MHDIDDEQMKSFQNIETKRVIKLLLCSSTLIKIEIKSPNKES